MKYNDHTVFASVINISASIIHQYHLYTRRFKKNLKSINTFCADVNLSEHWLMRGCSPSPELWKGADVDDFFLDFFDRVTFGLGSTSKIMIRFLF